MHIQIRMHPIQKTKHGLTFEAHLVVFHIHLPDPRARIKQKGIATMVGILERMGDRNGSGR
jgi:hypothetical protein